MPFSAWAGAGASPLPPGGTAVDGAAPSPAHYDAEEGQKEQEGHGQQDEAVAARQVVDEAVGGDEKDGGQGRAHGDLGVDLLIVLLPVKFQGEDGGEDHDAGAGEAVEEGGEGEEGEAAAAEEKARHGGEPGGEDAVAGL